MNENIRTYIMSNPKRNIIIVLGVILVCAICVWCYIRADSRIDTTGIHNATKELNTIREYNRQSIEYNRRIGNAVIHSQDLNERAITTSNRIAEYSKRTETAIDRSTELVRDAKQDATNAKRIIGESRSILENARKRTQESTTGQP